MLNSKSFLSLDFGAGSLKLAEFQLTEAGGLCLKQFGIKPLGLEGTSDAARERVLLEAIQSLAAAHPFGAKIANVCAPGFQVFSKFVKLPPVDSSKVTQIIQYEAQQNVPFPLDEVVWDYQIIGNTPNNEMEVFLVAIKADLVEAIFRTTAAAGLKLQLVDISHAALRNAFSFNYGDLDGCSMVLDIGAKTSNVLFFEKGRFNSRSINIGANSITQDFAAEAKIRFAEAEKFKISDGFVSLGGAYEEPDNPKQAQISKIARQVLTRLHIQVNQTLQFYRGQQGGSAPQRLFLSGGASIMPYTAEFFAEKLNLPVEYFNPLKNVQIDPSVNLEELAKVAHSFGEVVGLALRNLAQCPIELNLVPKKIRKNQQFNQKKPYFIASVASLAVGLFAIGYIYDQKVIGGKDRLMADIDTQSAPLATLAEKVDKEKAQLDKIKAQLEQVSNWGADRRQWNDILLSLRTALMDTEAQVASATGTKTGLWIRKMVPDLSDMEAMPDAPAEPTAAAAPIGGDANSRRAMMERYGRFMTQKPAADPAAPKKTGASNEVGMLTLTCEAVNLKASSPTANDLMVFTFQDKLKSMTNLFDSKETTLSGSITLTNITDATFTFDVNLKLKRPVKL